MCLKCLLKDVLIQKTMLLALLGTFEAGFCLWGFCADQSKQKLMTLESGGVRRFCLHVLPPGFENPTLWIFVNKWETQTQSLSIIRLEYWPYQENQM
jgi:hypothetical protein